MQPSPLYADFFSSDICPRVGQLGHIVILFLLFWRSSIIFIDIILIYIPGKSKSLPVLISWSSFLLFPSSSFRSYIKVLIHCELYLSRGKRLGQVSIFCIEYPVFPIPFLKVVLLFPSKSFGSFIEPVGFQWVGVFLRSLLSSIFLRVCFHYTVFGLLYPNNKSWN